MNDYDEKKEEQRLSKLKLSVIIPTHNRADIVIMNLRSLARQILPCDQFEVLVCDDASTDDTYKRLQQLSMPYDLRLFRLDECGGPGKARNMLIKEAKAEALVILNDDAILSPAGLAMHAQSLEILKEKKIAVLGKFTFPADYQRTPFGCLLEHTNLSFRFPIFESGALYGAAGFYSCNLGILASAIADAGYFNEDFHGTGAEDIELGDRLAKKGNMVVYIDKCVAVHEHRMTIHDFCRAQIGRGGGGVLRVFNDFNMIFHYDDMGEAELKSLRSSLDEAEPFIDQLKDLVHILHLKRSVSDSVQTPADIVWLNEPLRYSSHDQWKMSPRAIIKEAEKAIAEVKELFQNRVLDGVALGRLFQICSFLKWRYDTVGIACSPWIDEYVTKRSERKKMRCIKLVRD